MNVHIEMTPILSPCFHTLAFSMHLIDSLSLSVLSLDEHNNSTTLNNLIAGLKLRPA